MRIIRADLPCVENWGFEMDMRFNRLDETGILTALDQVTCTMTACDDLAVTNVALPSRTR